MRTLSTHCLIPLASLCVLLSAGCDAGGGDATGPEMPVEPEMKTVFDGTVNVLSVRASKFETCDGKLLFGGVNPGEFQAMSIIYRGDTELSRRSTSGYNSVLGISHELGPDKSASHPHSASFTGAEVGEDISILFRATEWDATERDARLNNVSDKTTISFGPETKNGSDFVFVFVGSGICGLKLAAEVDIKRRRVPVT